MLKEDALSILCRRAEHEDLDMLHFYYMIKYEECYQGGGKSVNEMEYGVGCTQIYTGRQFFTEVVKFNGGKLRTVWSFLFSKSFLIKSALRFYEGCFAEDALFLFMAIMKAQKVSDIADVLYIYRKRNNSVCTTLDGRLLQSYYFVFSEILNYWKNNEFTEEENEAIKRWLMDWLVNLREISYHVKDDTPLAYGTVADKFLYEIIKADRLNLCKYINFSDEKKKLIKKAKSVIIYGAGSAGKECYWYLDKEGINIKAFAVSAVEGNPQRLFQLDVVQVDNIKADKDDVFIVAVSKQYQNDIVSRLNLLGYTNALLPD
jgi:hypothetical protein